MVASLRLNTGAAMPTIGLGVGSSEDRTVDAIGTAIEIGYRCFDTAQFYGTEPVLGVALAKAFHAGKVRREEVFVTTKLNPMNADPADVMATLRSSLLALQLDYVDLFLVHWPLRTKKTIDFGNLQPGDIIVAEQKELWSAMESCVDAGLAKAIGVSNWSIPKLEKLLGLARIPPAVNQVEVHPLWRQDKLREFCKKKGIVVTAYSPLGAPNSTYGVNDVITNSTITDVAKRSQKSPAQVILRWLAEKEVSFVVRSYNSSRLAENFNALDSAISDADLKTLDSIPEQKKALPGLMFIQPEHGPFKSLKDLWDE